MSRKPIPDLLKGVAVILMIQVHIMELFMLPEVYEGKLGMVSLFLGAIPAAPVFMAVMGYFAALSGKSINQQIWRGIKLIGLGLLLNIGLNAHLLILILKGSLDIDPLQFIFGADILFLAGLSLIFISLLRFLAGQRIWVFVAFTFIIPAIAEFTPFLYEGEPQGVINYVQAFIISNMPWSYFPFFPWAGWVLAGYSFALMERSFGEKSGYKKFSTYLVYFSIIPVSFFLSWALEITTYLPYYYHHGILFFLWGLFFCLIWVLAWKFILEMSPGNRIMKYLVWMGKNVTLAYVVQWLLIGNIATAIYRTQAPLIFWLSVVLLTLVTSVIIRLVSPFLSSGSMPRK